jgi:hypothetical protein
MSIIEVKIDRISKEEKYYRQKADQYLTEHEPTIVKYKWKQPIPSARENFWRYTYEVIQQ